ncbi:MAG: hypothetical protein NUV73_03270 [Candidatus Daviesbacteria bacterium]|nr:hypothetical protein [Candidatus Daviesbacteria bacterium]
MTIVEGGGSGSITGKDSRPITSLEKAMGARFGAPDATERLEALAELSPFAISLLSGETVSTLHKNDLPGPLQELNGRRAFVPTRLIELLT